MTEAPDRSSAPGGASFGPTAPAPLARPVVLVGLMASGKSTTGRRLATRLGVPFVDVDAEIERREGATAAEIFAERGEAAWRALEAPVIAELLASGAPVVVATGGGAVLDPSTRRLLREGGTVVWLHAAPAVLAHRVRPDGSRPLLAGGDVRATLERLSRERAPLYAEVADHVVEVGGGDRRAILAEILRRLGRSDGDAPGPPENDLAGTGEDPFQVDAGAEVPQARSEVPQAGAEEPDAEPEPGPTVKEPLS